MRKITLTKITCNSRSSGDASDEVFVMYQSDGDVILRYPLTGHHSMDDGDSWTLPDGGLSFDFEAGAFISLWDDDFALDAINAPDILGNKLFLNNWGGGDYDISGTNGASYTLTIKMANAD